MGNRLEFQVESHIAREIFAVVYLAASFLLLLSIYGKLGVVGEALHGFLKPVFGFGIHFVPIAFFGMSLAMFFSKKPIFSLARITGLTLMFMSLLSIFHLSLATEEILTSAQAGSYGGYIGFVTNFLLRDILQIGTLGSSIIFVAGLIVGILLTFEVSIIAFLKSATPTFEKRKVKEVVDAEEIPVEHTSEASEINIIKPISSNDNDENYEDDEKLSEMLTEDEEQAEQAERSGAIRSEVEIGPDQEGAEITEKPVKHHQIINWEFPPLDILEASVSSEAIDDEILKRDAQMIQDKLAQFGIQVEMHDVHVGPTVFQYTLRPHEGVKLSKITALKNDLALALAAPSIRIEAPIPGKSLVGIEVPNVQRSIVALRELLESDEYKTINSQLRLPLGRNVSGKPMVADLVGMPHLLIAGQTGAGKSVGINSFLLSLLYQNSPADLKFIMIDPKRVELSSYNGIPHLLTPVITDVEKAATALRWAVAEMNRRYVALSETGHRNLVDFNADPAMEEKMPRIIVLVDELADLMMAAGKDVEASICRIAQMARAVGMHLIVATQRPSVDVITGLIKANMACRIAYAVASGVDSRTILDSIGAEDLLGQGDMLYIAANMAKPVRIQGTYVSTKEIQRVTDRIKLTMEPEYDDAIISGKSATQKVQGLPPSSLTGQDPLYEQALKVIIESRKASASLLQRRMEIGYARAARILDEMEAGGVIGPVRGAKPREIYVLRGETTAQNITPEKEEAGFEYEEEE